MERAMKVKTACPLDCWDTCSIIADVQDGVVTRLDGDEDHPVTQGFLCGKGRRLKDRLYAPDRLLYPQKKTAAGGWARISWEQAYDEIAQHIRAAMENHGHQAILHAFDYGSGTALKELNQRFFYLLGGCTETVGSLCWDAGLEAQRYDFGQARSHAPDDTALAKAIIVWGRNVSTTNIHMMPFIRRAQANGAVLVNINPLATDLDGRADLCIHPRPGSDAALAFGVLKICRDNGWLDDSFVRDSSVGWGELSAYLDGFDASVVTRWTDVPANALHQLAEIYGQTRGVATLLGIGLQRYPGGGNAIRAIDALAAATGQVGIAGGGVHYAQRALTSFLDSEFIRQRNRAQVREFTRGGQAEDILAADPPIQVMFVTRTNTVTQVPDTRRLLEAYATIGCKIVIDQFMTPTAQLADYLLPCTNVLEEEDFAYSTMWHANITYIQPVVAPRGEAKPDWRIFADLAMRLGFGPDMDRPLDEWLAGMLRPLADHGLGLADLKERGTLTLPIDPIPWADGRFLTPTGKFEFASATAAADGHTRHAVFKPARETLGAYPYALLTIHPRVSENSQHRDFPALPDYPIVEIPTDIALQKGLSTGDLARLWNDQASLQVRVRIADRGHAFTVKLESGWWGQGVTINHLTRSHRADFGQQTAQYDCACDLEKLVDSKAGP